MFVTLCYCVCMIGIVVSAYVTLRGIQMSSRQGASAHGETLVDPQTGEVVARLQDRFGGYLLVVIGLIGTLFLTASAYSISEQADNMSSVTRNVIGHAHD
jgi:hypothetical protein